MKTRITTLFLSATLILAFALTTHNAWAAGTPTSPVVIDLATVSTNGDGYTFTSASVTTSTNNPSGSTNYESYTFTDNVVTIIESGWYTITGSTSDKRIVVQSGITANTTLRNATINLPIRTYACAFDVQASAVVSLTLDGENILKSGYRCAGLQIPVGATLTIINPASDITNKLNASGGGDAGTNGGAGIGGGSMAGNITINGGEITATGGGGSAGIGGGKAGAGGYITINGGKITTTGSLIGRTISDFNGGTGSSGIGGGVDGDGGHITINGGEVTATGAGAGAGIGGGKAGAGGDIVITGGIVTATSRDLTGGDNQYSFGTGAGIGGGGRQNSGNIIITGSANVTAQAGKAWSGLGGGLGGVAGSGAGIGSGGGGGGGYSTVGSVNMIVINTTGVVTVNVPTNGDAGSTDQYNGARIGEGGGLDYSGAEYLPLTAVDAYHTVAITQGANGTIVAFPNSNETQIVKRANQTYKITPDAGYEIVSVTVDGMNVGAIPYHTIPGIMDNNHTITATFAAMYAASLDKSGTYTFTGATYGAALTPEPITITNTGLYPTGNLSVVLSGTNAADFTLSTSTLSSIAIGGTGSFTVVPNAGLDVGTYAATIIVSGGNGITATFNVSFAVSKATAPSITFPTSATTVTYGQPLSNAVLDITTNIYGDFAWTDGSVKPTVVNSGYEVTFTPNEATKKNYSPITPATATIPIMVNQKDLSEATVTINGLYIHNNAAHMPVASNVIVSLAGYGMLASPADYTYAVTAGGTALGPATVTVTGTGNFIGSATGTFRVVQAYNVTVSSAGSGVIGSGNYIVGETVDLYAGTAPSRYRFSNWTVSGASLADANRERTSFIMPANDVTVTANFEFIPIYYITAGSFNGGAVSANITSAGVGETITLTVQTNAGYRFDRIVAFKTGDEATTVETQLIASSQTYAFTMPAYDVTVKAMYTTLDQIAIEEATEQIMSAVFDVQQTAANTQSEILDWLVETINAQLAPTGVSVAANNIVLINFMAAIAGTENNPSGRDGAIRFQLTITKGNSSATIIDLTAVIAATRYFPAGIEDIPQAKAMKAYVQNGTLYISGLTAGEQWSVYNISGSLIYSGVANNDEVSVSLSARGMYIVKSGKSVVKVMD